MKKIICYLLVVMLMLPLVGCNKGEKTDFDPIAEFGSDELYVYNWGEYIGENTIDEFERRYNVTVHYKTFDSNEEMYTTLLGGDSYDIIVPSDYMVERLIKENMIQKLDISLITNIDNIADNLDSPNYDPDHSYSIPYFQGTVGIVYDTTKVDPQEVEEKGWDILFDSKYAGQVYMYDADRDNFMPAMKALGFSLNTNDPNEIQQCYDLLMKQRKEVNPGYVTDEVNDDMINGLKALAVVYSGAASYIISENEDMAYCEPYQGTNIWSDAMCIPSNAKNVKLAHAWINFNLEKEVAIDNSLCVGYTSGNKLALEELSNGEFKDISSYNIRTGYQLDEEYHDDESLKKTLGELWTHVKAGN